MYCTAHENCSACPDNATASCPMFIWSMNYEQLVNWIKNEMKDQGMSHQKLSDLTGIPKATIDGILAGRQRDVGHYTLSPIVRVLMKRYLASSPCRSVAITAKAAEVTAKDELIADLRAQLRDAREASAAHRDTIADLRARIKKLESLGEESEY